MTNSIRPIVVASLMGKDEAPMTSSGTLPSGYDSRRAGRDGTPEE